MSTARTLFLIVRNCIHLSRTIVYAHTHTHTKGERQPTNSSKMFAARLEIVFSIFIEFFFFARRYDLLVNHTKQFLIARIHNLVVGVVAAATDADVSC